jgi:hypothetical protein
VFQSNIITKRAKLKLYHLIIRPIATYSCKTWILKETIINKLLIFERKILRKIFGPNNENGICLDDVWKDIQKLKVPNWKTLAQDRRGWKEKLVEKTKTL